jgi:glutamate racemase
MKIGVFDSGVGGLSVANAIRKSIPDIEVLVREDAENLPYGTKSAEELLSLVTPILQSMVLDGCKVIVIACNTVTTTIIHELRKQINVPLVGMEPMVKTAARISKTHAVAVFATPTTLHSPRYQWLKETYAAETKVIEPDCSNWAAMVQSNSVNIHDIAVNVESALASGADVLVLGCTHYHWIEELILELSNGRAEVLQPEVPVIQQLKTVIQKL